MRKAAFYTLGCKVNQYETEAISGIFQRAGYQVVDFEEVADVYVINTCTVTSLSDRKSRQMIRRARNNNKDAIVAVVGCYAQTAPEEVKKIPGVNLVIGTRDRGRIIDYINELRQHGGQQITAVDNIMAAKSFEELAVTTYKGRTRAFLKIQEGCSQFCSYCIIPYARGPIRSRRPEDIVHEVERLANGGFKEIVLTGIHVASYGRDLGTTSLLDIVRRVHEVQGIERIRLGSVEPTVVDKEFVDTAAGLKKLCPHYHISLQSGCDETLKRMNRKYNTEQYKRVVDMLRCRIEDVAVTTDVMVGFPGETDREFETTYNFLTEMAFAKMHIFKYSARKGTPAAAFKDQVPPELKEERSRRLNELSQKCTFRFNAGYRGRRMPVLYEQEAGGKEGYMEGLTPNYIRVLSPGNMDLKGEIKDTRLEEAVSDYMTGEVV
ncbi:MAG: tRNA (N(6)-L-threonylcarbamoyladenosine(37)-C(2))-methylthiotransferase MtaB [Clostridiales bacterium]|nr:tRNA (N(6)-L-threonylcarbamoyladenosine(37)-C(2))-methylthiotransferase MtaB [Eubacteriales bacterium]MDH7567257.1 tRNA (N(6)-L-threonylcarbamoyladenosine(37)-C(2))-methylthiotransferase MtaB [Clostridiales bacterium]